MSARMATDKQLLLAFALLAAATGTACRAGRPSGSADAAVSDARARAAPNPHLGGSGPTAGRSPFGTWNPRALLDRLQGSWQVGSDTWEVTGDAVTITGPGGVRSGYLVVESPVRLAVVYRKLGGITRELYAFAFEGESLHIGFGDAGVRVGDSRWVSELAMAGVLVFDDGTCTLYRQQFDRLGTPIETSCLTSPDPGGTHTVLTVSLPASFRVGTSETKALYLLRDAILDSRMISSRARRL